MPKKIVIPKQKQIPIVIGLAVFFILLLGWNIIKTEGSEASGAEVEISGTGASTATGAEADQSALETVSAADLVSLVAEIKKSNLELRKRPLQVPPIKRNPFMLAQPVLTDPMLVDDLEIIDDLDIIDLVDLLRETDEPTREDRLRSLTLSATCVMGGQSIGIINGGYFHRGDSISGFTIDNIAEREVTLSDAMGSETLRIAAARPSI